MHGARWPQSPNYGYSGSTDSMPEMAGRADVRPVVMSFIRSQHSDNDNTAIPFTRDDTYEGVGHRRGREKKYLLTVSRHSRFMIFQSAHEFWTLHIKAIQIKSAAINPFVYLSICSSLNREAVF